MLSFLNKAFCLIDGPVQPLHVMTSQGEEQRCSPTRWGQSCLQYTYHPLPKDTGKTHCLVTGWGARGAGLEGLCAFPAPKSELPCFGHTVGHAEVLRDLATSKGLSAFKNGTTRDLMNDSLPYNSMVPRTPFYLGNQQMERIWELGTKLIWADFFHKKKEPMRVTFLKTFAEKSVSQTFVFQSLTKISKKTVFLEPVATYHTRSEC